MNVTAEDTAFTVAFQIFGGAQQATSPVVQLDRPGARYARTVEAVPSHSRALGRDQAVLSNFHLGVPEILQAIDHLNRQGQQRRHAVTDALGGQLLGEIHQTTAFAIHGMAISHKIAQGSEEGLVGRELLGINFRITAAYVQPIQFARECRVRKRAHVYQLSPLRAQNIEGGFIVERKRKITSDPDPHSFTEWLGTKAGKWVRLQLAPLGDDFRPRQQRVDGDILLYRPAE